MRGPEQEGGLREGLRVHVDQGPPPGERSVTSGEEICIDRIGSLCDLYQTDEWVKDRDLCDKNPSCKAQGTKKKWTCVEWYQSPYYISTATSMCKSKHIIQSEA